MQSSRLFSTKTLQLPHDFSQRDLQSQIEYLVNTTRIDFSTGWYANVIQNPLLLDFVLEKVEKREMPINVVDFTSMISRCIEYSATDAVYSNKDIFLRVLNFCKRMEITGPLSLRRVRNVEFLRIAAEYGFHDPELTKRIVLMQRKFRNQELPRLEFEGRKPGADNDYFGYRDTLYFIKYDRKHRLDVFKHCDYGDCNAEAYANYLGDEIDREVYDKIRYKQA